MSEGKSRYELFLEEEERKTQPTKRCSKCKKVKALSEYHKQSTAKLGVTPRCKECSRRNKYKDRVDLFWKRYWKLVKSVDGCLEWQGCCDGNLPVCRWEWRKTGVRIIVYQLALGIEVPTGMSVMTTCNNKNCVRQSHLKLEELNLLRYNNLVVARDNRGSGERHWLKSHPELVRRGEQANHVTINEPLVRQIRQLRGQGLTGKVISETLGIRETTVWSAIYNWRHVQ